jgi:uncharacterized membrane-anchored protein YjiN (DUF445 family)
MSRSPNHEFTPEERRRGSLARAEKLRRERDELRRRVAEVRRDLVDDAIARRAEGMRAAIDSLVALATSAQSEAARVSASRAVVELGLRLREDEEFELRLAQLEEAASQRNGHR